MADVQGAKPINLGIGDIQVVTEPSVLSTVLGSCVCVCFFDEKSGVSGMNHYMLPEPMGNNSAGPGRFGTLSIPELLERMLASGAKRHQIIAKVFGGGQVLPQLSGVNSVASRNIEVAQRVLGMLRIPVVAQDTGGNHGRKVFFYTDTGKVMVRAVGNTRFEAG